MYRMVFRSSVVMAAILVAGCSQPPPKGGATKDELEAKIAESNNWRDVSLQESTDRGYKGTAVTSEGKSLNIEVGESSGGISVQWKRADGDGEGNIDIKW